MYETTVPTSSAGRQSWREEARRDRLVGAQIDRDREAARTRGRIAEREAAAAARRSARAQARADRAARRAALAAWGAGHVTDLLFVPVIAVPAVLSWTAMAAYGASLYGPAGRALPALSEGAMWAFAAAVTITRHRHPGRPVWHLRLGTVVFAGFGAALNFAHGLSAYGPVAGVVMALVSVAGVTAHQLVTAGPRRGRSDREADRIARAITRRERAARRAAVRRAPVDLDADGTARLVFESGAAALSRRFGRVRLIRVSGETRGQGDAQDDAAVTGPGPVPDAVWSPVPDSAESAAAASYRATLAAGNPWSGRQLETRFGLSRAQAAKVRDRVHAEVNARQLDDDQADGADIAA
jgi:hypothetical protein